MLGKRWLVFCDVACVEVSGGCEGEGSEIVVGGYKVVGDEVQMTHGVNLK